MLCQPPFSVTAPRASDIPYRISSDLHSGSFVLTMRMRCPANTAGGNGGAEAGYQPKDPPVNSPRTTVAKGTSMRNCWVRTHAVHLVRYRTNRNTLLVAKRCESPYCILGPWSRCTLRLSKCSECGHAIC